MLILPDEPKTAKAVSDLFLSKRKQQKEVAFITKLVSTLAEIARIFADPRTRLCPSCKGLLLADEKGHLECLHCGQVDLASDS